MYGVSVDGDLARRQRLRCRTVRHGSVGDLELAAVARAVDRALGHLADLAAGVRALGREALERALRRLRHDDVLVLEDLAATDRDVGRLGERLLGGCSATAAGIVAARVTAAGLARGVAAARATGGVATARVTASVGAARVAVRLAAAQDDHHPGCSGARENATPRLSSHCHNLPY
jgi:hypothetical protein